MSEAAVGVVVVTHGGSGAAMVMTVQALVGDVEGVTAFGVRRDETREAIAAVLAKEIAKVERGAGVLVLCDLHGATPSNCAVEIKKGGANVAVLCGVSLPMLVKVVTSDRAHATPGELAHAAAETAIRSIRLGEGGPA